MQQSKINQKIARFGERARLERLQSPEIVQKTKAVRHPSGGIKARIIQTLQYEDQEKGLEKINWYEIEFLDHELKFWSSTYGTYNAGDIVKYIVDSVTKIFECTREHPSHPSLPPTVTSYWKEATATKAWVFGYSGDLIEASPWLQPEDIVEVIKYIDDRWPDREWWILETATRIRDGDNYSLMWHDEEDRLMAVFG